MISESLWKILSFVLAIVLMILFPLLHLYEKQDEIVYYRVLDHANEFVNTVKYKGYIDEKIWNEFYQKINSYGYTFELSVSHKEAENIPVYGNPQDPDSFTGKTKKVYFEHPHIDIMDVIFPENQSAAMEDRVYDMEVGDFVILDVKSTHNTKADVLRNSFLNSDIDNPFHIRFSGMIMQ